MRIRHLMLGLRGRIGRVAFACGLIAAVGLLAIGLQGAASLLSLLGPALQPHGIDQELASKVARLAMGMLFVWSVIALGVKRLRDRGRSVWWIVVVIVPLAVLALLNDALFDVGGAIRLPREVQLGVLVASSLVGLWMLADCLIGLSTREPGKRVRARPAALYSL